MWHHETATPGYLVLSETHLEPGLCTPDMCLLPQAVSLYEGLLLRPLPQTWEAGLIMVRLLGLTSQLNTSCGSLSMFI